MISVASVCNNYGETYDGIGHYAKKQNEVLSQYMKMRVYSGKCTQEASLLKKFFSGAMCRAIDKLIKDFMKEKFDICLVEYPFVEWNPFVYFRLRKLSKYLHKDNKGFVLSLHEYGRVKGFRKSFIKIIIPLFDKVLVSNEDTKEELSGFCKDVLIRRIPSNIYDQDTLKKDIQRYRNRYCYFGLVNHSKAFYELIESWQRIRYDNDLLYVLSSTNLEDIEEKYKGLKYLHNESDAHIIEVLKSSIACFIPAIPEVDMKNATFKTASLCGCICIGKFCAEFSDLPFVINLKDYSEESFRFAKRQIDAISDQDIIRKTEEARAFGLQYTPENIFKNLACLLEGIVDNI